MNDDLSREEEQGLRAMKRDIVPPARIEERLVDTLRRDRLIAPRRRWVTPAAAAAAVLLAFVAGMMMPRRTSPPARPAEATHVRFAILLYSGDIRSDAPRRHEEYAEWARGVASQGVEISGEDLADQASDPAGPRGFFIVAARDADAARAIAASCPHVKYGGRVVVRKIVS